MLIGWSFAQRRSGRKRSQGLGGSRKDATRPRDKRSRPGSTEWETRTRTPTQSCPRRFDDQRPNFGRQGDFEFNSPPLNRRAIWETAGGPFGEARMWGPRPGTRLSASRPLQASIVTRLEGRRDSAEGTEMGMIPLACLAPPRLRPKYPHCERAGEPFTTPKQNEDLEYKHTAAHPFFAKLFIAD